MSPENARKIVAVLDQFGFAEAGPTVDLFLKENQVIRMGVPPLRIELLTSISGVEFRACFTNRTTAVIDEVEVHFIGLQDLKVNKQASGRLKDLDDLEHLP